MSLRWEWEALESSQQNWLQHNTIALIYNNVKTLNYKKIYMYIYIYLSGFAKRYLQEFLATVSFETCSVLDLVCYTAVFSVVTKHSSPQTASENRTTFLSLCTCGMTRNQSCILCSSQSTPLRESRKRSRDGPHQKRSRAIMALSFFNSLGLKMSLLLQLQ